MVIKNIPLSRQIVQEIISGIQSGTLTRENGALPSEAELSQRFDVSRATIREALSLLEQRGTVIRRHGVGTFVAPTPRIDTGLEELESLETLARRIGLETRMGNPTIEERGAGPGEAECLQVPPGTPVLSIARVILTTERPTERRPAERAIAYLVDIVPTSVLRREDLDRTFRGSVLDLFIHRGDLALSHSRTDISIQAADETIARALNLQEGEPLHKLEAQLYTRDGRIVDYSTSYFVPGYFHFHVIRRIGQTSGAPVSS
ncbi:MAG: GntR family transcriptional regulator [Chloroflexi bacterium]|nr:GntR family transcriptional regulator [Chloroflexota bacterium]MCL5951529.1 GntR family transcriptional regulator [Chloroflexota bacterium]